ncbi:hypothetical protein ACLQ3K_21865 [Tsukamurella sp. DT100]|uniref:hypothetical protein n=1 Tax=Tsukamurella sp. DT100 TaxID=3393415 RepID=UPI003CF57404
MDWERLGNEVAARRVQLRLTQQQVQERGGPSATKQRELENGRTSVLSASKRRDLERALDWQPGSVEAILDGGDPTPARLGEGLAALIPVGMDRREESLLLPSSKGNPEYIQQAARLARPTREYRLLAANLDLAEKILDHAEAAVEPWSKAGIRSQMPYIGDLLDSVARYSDIVSGPEFESVQGRVRQDSERYATQRLRLGMSLGIEGTGMGVRAALGEDWESRIDWSQLEQFEDVRRAIGELEEASRDRHGDDVHLDSANFFNNVFSRWLRARGVLDADQADFELAARDLGAEPVGRKVRRAQDEAGELPDPEGPEGGA